MYLHGTSRINSKGHLEIGGVDTVELVKEFGTPLIVYDVALIKEKAAAFLNAFSEENVKAQVAYASKAFSCIAILQLMNELGLSLDVVSGGELYTAMKARFPMERIHFHGNNKTKEEIHMAVEAGIGSFVVDNFYEMELLEEASERFGRTISVLLRTTPGIEAHTHEYISTGQEDSKFGFDLASGQVDEAIRKVLTSKRLQLKGLHCHIGSQIFEVTGFVKAAEKIFGQMRKWKEELEYVPKVLNLGGGFGIRYIEGDKPLPLEEYVKSIVRVVKEESSKLGIDVPEIWIEPGRSLVGDAGTTLYTIGSQKEVPNIRHYVAVDGGMADNLRPALYQAEYEGMLANRADAEPEGKYSIAGRCCESGDMLIWDLPLPKPKPGDILAVSCTGAYGYAMANNYNRIPRPAVVFVENKKATLVIKRETYEDLTRLDLPLK